MVVARIKALTLLVHHALFPYDSIDCYLLLSCPEVNNPAYLTPFVGDRRKPVMTLQSGFTHM